MCIWKSTGLKKVHKHLQVIVLSTCLICQGIRPDKVCWSFVSIIIG